MRTGSGTTPMPCAGSWRAYWTWGSRRTLSDDPGNPGHVQRKVHDPVPLMDVLDAQQMRPTHLSHRIFTRTRRGNHWSDVPMISLLSDRSSCSCVSGIDSESLQVLFPFRPRFPRRSGVEEQTASIGLEASCDHVLRVLSIRIVECRRCPVSIPAACSMSFCGGRSSHGMAFDNIRTRLNGNTWSSAPIQTSFFVYTSRK